MDGHAGRGGAGRGGAGWGGAGWGGVGWGGHVPSAAGMTVSGGGLTESLVSGRPPGEGRGRAGRGGAGRGGAGRGGAGRGGHVPSAAGDDSQQGRAD